MFLTKSDFLLYLECPLHLWAKKHNLLEKNVPSEFDQFIMAQGRQAEELAAQYFLYYFSATAKPGDSRLYQSTYSDGAFLARADETIIQAESGKMNLYEIKSSTKVKKEHLYDATFQLLVVEAKQAVDRVFLVHLNPDYVYDGHYVFEKLFVFEDITERCRNLSKKVDNLRQQALLDLAQTDSNLLAHCYHPQKCPCPDLCHPNLPTDSIYNLPNLSQKKIDLLLNQGIKQIKDIPDDFVLSQLQRKYTQVIKKQRTFIDSVAIKKSLAKLVYPLYFLDYETCNLALPLYPGYHPQQQMVFQYSLHIITEDGSMKHCEYLADGIADPAVGLVKQLRQDIGDIGSVIVWNETFESGRNKELAQIYPKFDQFLLSLNKRIYDLAEIFRRGDYIDSSFEGSWSIKKILPVLVPELNYTDLEISQGSEAMLAWWEMTRAGLSMPEKLRNQIKEALLRYCEMDTRAMVEIWKKLKAII